MTLIQLRYLSAIVEAGLNISLAARQLNASQPAVSKQLKQLEKGLGVELFRRKGKGLAGLTPTGDLVLGHARTILDGTANIGSLSASYRRDRRGELRISTTHTQARFVLANPLAAVKARYPDLSLYLAPVGEKEALEHVGQDVADIAIVSGVERPATGALVIPLFTWRLVGLAPVGHPLAAAGAVTLLDLARYPLVTYESAAKPGSSLAREFADAGLQPRLAFTARESDLIKTYVEAGLGVGLLAEMAVTGSEAGLRSFDLGGAIPERTAWAVIQRDQVDREGVLEFVSAIAPQLSAEVLSRAIQFGTEEVDLVVPAWRSLQGSRRQPVNSAAA